MKCNKCGRVFVEKENCSNQNDETLFTVCPDCGNEKLYDKVPWDSNRCQICGNPMINMNVEHVCSTCKIKYRF